MRSAAPRGRARACACGAPRACPRPRAPPAALSLSRARRSAARGAAGAGTAGGGAGDGKFLRRGKFLGYLTRKGGGAEGKPGAADPSALDAAQRELEEAAQRELEEAAQRELEEAARRASAAQAGVRVRSRALGRAARVSAARVCLEVEVAAPADAVWAAINEHEKTAGQRGGAQVVGAGKGQVILEQRVLRPSIYYQLGAYTSAARLERREAVLGRELRFEALEGECESFRGRWVIEGGQQQALSLLRYEAEVVPPEGDGLPARALERHLRSDAEVGLRAVAERAAAAAAASQAAANLAAAGGSGGGSGSGGGQQSVLSAVDLRDFDPERTWALPEARAAAEAAAKAIEGTSALDALQQEAQRREQMRQRRVAGEDNVQRGVFGVASVPLPQNTVVEDRAAPPVSAGVQEVHLRNLDDALYKRRRCLAVAVVDAPPEAVWSVLTDYEAYPDFLPTVAVSNAREVAPRRGDPAARGEGRRLRLTQVGYAFLPYAALRARCVLDLVERPRAPAAVAAGGESGDADARDRDELLFQLVEGDFDKMQGRWLVEAVLPGDVEAAGAADADGAAAAPTRSRLVYMAEVRTKQMFGRFRKFSVIEPMMERVAYEDVPRYLEAIRERVEATQAVAAAESAASMAAVVCDEVNDALADDILASAIAAFDAEHCAALGEGVMPRQADVIAAGRSDLARAIDAAGGFAQVAQRLGLRPAGKQVKPRGYWQNIENLRAEMSALIAEQQWDPTRMPTRAALKRVGRMDIVRATEVYGGMREVAQLLGLKASRAGGRRKAPRKSASGESTRARGARRRGEMAQRPSYEPC